MTAELVAPAESVPERRGRGRPGRQLAVILVVDDSVTIRRILRGPLEAAGYRVTEAPDGREALVSCRSDRPDLILLDVDMPVMDGLQTLAAIQADTDLCALPVLLLTARTSGAEVAAGFELGAQDYLRKPCETSELLARVAGALNLKARENSLRARAVELDELSATDPLTGLGNRRHLDLEVAATVARHGGDRPTGVALIDIDHFKAVNDSEGHLVGDVVLKILAGRVRNVVGGHTFVRWGGEEFLILVGLGEGDGDGPETAVRLVAEHAREVVSARMFAIPGGRAIAVTISVGCAWGAIGELDRVVGMADAALYEAKRNGRNRVEVAPAHG
jgi:two-component system cell cycle response regulator